MTRHLTCACGADLKTDDPMEHAACLGVWEVREMSLEEMRKLYPQKQEPKEKS